jgi:hypothetical protein
MERVTQQAQSLAGQVSDQANKAATTLRTGRAGRQWRGPMGALMANARVPASTRFAWRAGQATGRLQGASALAPLAARGWRLALTHRMRAMTARTQLRAQARWLPLSLAGTQLVGRTRLRLRQVGQLPLVTRGATSNGARAATKAPARPTPPKPQAAPKPSITPKQQAAVRARSARARQRLWRAAWMFAIGLAIGGGWAYLYAQRRGPGYDAWRQRASDTPQA